MGSNDGKRSLCVMVKRLSSQQIANPFPLLTKMQKLSNIIESPYKQPQDVRMSDDDRVDLLVSVKVDRDELDLDPKQCMMCRKALRTLNVIKTDYIDSSCTKQTTSHDVAEEFNSPSVCFDCFTQMTSESRANNSEEIAYDESYDINFRDGGCSKKQTENSVFCNKLTSKLLPLELGNIKVEKEDSIHKYKVKTTMICDSCKSIFFSKSDLRRHTAEFNVYPESIEGVYNTSNCTLETQRSKALSLKSSEHKKENTYQCKVCPKSYLKKNNLIKHERKHTIESYICRVCRKKLSSRESLKRHMLTHTGEKPFQCKVCYKRYAYSHCVVQHMRMDHPGQKPYQCEMCPETFAEKQLLFLHMRIHIFGETDSKKQQNTKMIHLKNEVMTAEEFDLNEMYLCDFCKGVFFSKSRLRRHIVTFNTFPHNDKASRTLQECVVILCTDKMCTECPKQFVLKEIIRKTEICYKYHCEECPKSFTRKASYIAHICSNESVKSGKTSKKLYQCRVCYKRLAELSTLKRHMRIHSGEKRYHCKCCLIKFSYSQTLYKHMQIQHPEEKPYECEFCPERFSQYNYLRYHTHTHLHRQCKVCDKIMNRDTLKEHMLMHEGVKPYKCKVCLKKFTYFNSWKRHMRIHTGEKPYQCKVCFKRFSNNLPAHMKKYHPKGK